MTNDNNKPVHEVRLGRIKAAIWMRQTEKNGKLFNVSISRLYKKEGETAWSFSDSFGRDDLPLVAKVADLAHTWIFAKAKEHEAE